MLLYETLEERIPKNHPLRPLRAMTDAALEARSSRFDELYSDSGRPAIPPEHLLRALLLQALYSIRSERMLVEQLECNLPFRWFVGLGMNEAAWNHPVLSKNRDRLLAGDVAREPFACVVEQARALRLLSDDHFTVDGRTTRHKGYEQSQKKRKLVEQIFGWMKATAGIRKTRHRGREKVEWLFTLAAAYNLVRIRNLMEATA